MLIVCFLMGFAAQMIDGTLGMAYGVSCNTFLQASLGFPPLLSSSLVHFSEIFTSGASAFSHFKLKNVDKKMFLSLLVPGIIGGVAGALLLTGFGDRLKNVVSVYLVIMGGVLIYKSVRNKPAVRRINSKAVYGIAAAGGMLDAAGGGGWGPVVTSTMLGASEDAAKTIGTVNAAEFFVTLAETAVFSLTLATVKEHWTEVIFLILGGVCASPIAAILCKKINKRVLLFAVGALVIGLNVYKLLTSIL